FIFHLVNNFFSILARFSQYLVRVETELQRGSNPVGTPRTARLFSGRVPSAFDANYGFDSHIHS
ncbi:TPA: hypothetical protein ACHLG9_004441, partial [Escherichia coli]